MKRLLLVLALAALAAGAWWFFRNGRDSAPQFQTAPVVRGDLTQVVTATGTLSPVVNVQVGSQISGNIQKLFADFNSEVKQGQVIAQLDAATYQAIVHQAEGDLAGAEAALQFAELTAKRQHELTASKIGTAADLDSSKAELLKAQALVRLRTAQLEKARVDLSRCTIYAPIDGIVISRDVDVGQTVAASLQAPIIFTIANDLRNMQIIANVAEADVGNVEVGQSVEFGVDAFQYRTFRGKVSQVRNKPITVQTVVTYDTVISVTNDDLKLKPGMTATVSIVVAQRPNALKLPNAALRYRPAEPPGSSGAAGPTARREGRPGGERRGGSGPDGGPRRERPTSLERTVYLLVDGKAQPVKVKLGISDSLHTEVLDGLKEGDAVITGAALQPGEEPRGSSNPFSGGGGGRGMRRF